MSKTPNPLAVGIDTGGTNTDAAVVDVVTRKVLASAKAPTTYYDYSVGINQALQALPPRLLRRSVRVGVSTTLATNAIAAGSGEPAGLILLGYPPMTTRLMTFEPCANVPGAMTIAGDPLEPLDEAGLVQAARQMIASHRLTALAVSGYAGIMNPAHEIRAAEILQQQFPLPVVQGHHLSMRLGAADRAVTAGWNARLLGNIARLIEAVQRVCGDLGLIAPVVVIRADGTAMPAAAARLRPVETILSGPAASIEGGLALAKKRNAVVVDVGGTTTDIGLAIGGSAAVRDEVAVVGGHTLAVRAVQEYTIALGGDSYIQFTGDGLIIGPRRVIPVSVLARQYPAFTDQLAGPHGGDDDSTLCQPADVFTLADPGPLPSTQNDPVVHALAGGPLLRRHLATALGLIHPSLIRADDVIASGRVALSALTPTDCLVAMGRADLGDRTAAQAALALYARRAGKTPEAFAQAVLDMFVETLSLAILQARLIAGGMQNDRSLIDTAAAALIRAALAGTDHMPVHMTLKLKEPIVAIGAPASTYIPPAGKRLSARTIVPAAAPAAAAVGAALAGLAVRATATICPTVSQHYSVHTEQGRYQFDTLDQAKTFLRQHLDGIIRQRTQQFAMPDANVSIVFTDRTAQVIGAEGLEPIWLECRVVAEATVHCVIDVQ